VVVVAGPSRAVPCRLALPWVSRHAYREGMFDLQDRVAVVTGAASGIGRALAGELASRGCHLAIADIDEAGLAQTAAGIAGRTVTTHVVDVADRAAVEGLVVAVLKAHGAVHLLINNAGITVDGSFHEQSVEDFETVVGVNLFGVYYGCKLFLPHLLQADRAAIVNVSSIFGIVGVPAQSSYCASKFAVRGLTETLWEELAHTGIQVSVVHPGGVRTNIVAGGKSYDAIGKERTASYFERNTMRPEAAARRIVDGLQAGRRRILVTREAVWLDRLKRLMPVWGNRVTALGMVRMLGLTDRVEARKEAMLAGAGVASAGSRSCSE
jgi:NAD(P)-dependent dehydrogenase (short-subunit alcohol dehydrogenase family)